MQPVRLGVPYTAGGPADVLAQQLSQKRGQPVIVDNKPGANEIVAAQEVARAPGDGYTFPMAADATFSLDKHLHSKIPYEPTAFVPVTELVNANLMLVARPDLPAGNLQEFVRYARQNPVKLDHSSVGTGGVNPPGTAWFDSMAGLQMHHIPCNGLPPALQETSAGRVDVGFAVIGGAVPLLGAGKLKALAVAAKTRSVIAPNVPTFAEAGYPQFDASFHFGVAVPRGMPTASARKFAEDASAVIDGSEFKARYLTNLGVEPVGDTPEQSAAFLVGDRALAEE